MAVSGDHADAGRTGTTEHDAEPDVDGVPEGDLDESAITEPIATEPDITGTGPDLDAIEADLDGVDTALGRLADGTYWTDEVTGEPLGDDLLTADPIARRA